MGIPLRACKSRTCIIRKYELMSMNGVRPLSQPSVLCLLPMYIELCEDAGGASQTGFTQHVHNGTRKVKTVKGSLCDGAEEVMVGVVVRCAIGSFEK